MMIKVCGMREPNNIRALSQIDGVDMMGLIFFLKSPRCVPATLKLQQLPEQHPKLVGVFVNETQRNVITQVINFRLDYVQLHGTENPTYLDNLRKAIVPDILPDIKIIKAISVREADDVKRWRDYEGHADLLLFDTKTKLVGGSGEQFDWSILQNYDGNIPFILSGGIGPEDTERVMKFHHPMCVGIDLNSRFEVAPAVKNTEEIQKFVTKVKSRS